MTITEADCRYQILHHVVQQTHQFSYNHRHWLSARLWRGGGGYSVECVKCERTCCVSVETFAGRDFGRCSRDINLFTLHAVENKPQSRPHVPSHRSIHHTARTWTGAYRCYQWLSTRLGVCLTDLRV